MPIYEYRCDECGAKFEKFVRLASRPVEAICPACNSRDVSKAFSTFGTAGFSTRGSAAVTSPACGPVG